MTFDQNLVWCFVNAAELDYFYTDQIEAFLLGAIDSATSEDERDVLSSMYHEFLTPCKEEKLKKSAKKLLSKKLRAFIIEHRNIGHDWQFTNEQKALLQQYYDANQLLVDCLNSDCYVSRDVQQEIEETLLLPISEIEKRKTKSCQNN